MTPKVSIIIPHFSRPRLLAESVASIFASSIDDFEIIIVDDGSSESDWAEVQMLVGERTRVMQRVDGRKGPSRCRNLGLLEARADYVIFIDSDDLIGLWCLEERLKAAEAFPNYDLWVFPVLLFRDQPGDLNLMWNEMVDGRSALERFLLSDPPWHTSSPLWRRAVLLQIGGFNEAVFYGDDADLHMRALLLGCMPRLFPDHIPDAFVRRSKEDRITNSMSEALIESRRARLHEGTKFLKSSFGYRRYLRAWEGQYFAEAEFLLFSLPKPGRFVDAVMNQWGGDGRPKIWIWMAVRCYFSIAPFLKTRWYLLLRILRRLIMLTLPGDYFPKGGSYNSAEVSVAVLDKIVERTGIRAVVSDSECTLR